MFSGHRSFRCPYKTPISRDVILSGGISMKLDRNIHHVSGHCWKGLQGQRSKVKVMSRPNAMTAEACISTVWRRDLGYLC